jgi:UDP-N-acetyl-D-glucosamine dehydrogenase
MPQFVIDRVIDALNDQSKPVKGSKIGILGIAYKKDVDDHRESPSFRLMELLIDRGAEVSYCDPHVPEVPAMRSFNVPKLTGRDMSPEYLQSLDCVLNSTDHSCIDYQEILNHSKLVVDTRNAMGKLTDPDGKVFKA